MKLSLSVLALLVLASVALAGRGGKRRGCRRAAGQGVAESGPGTRFVWTMTGLDDDDLRVTFTEGAFAPDESTSIFKYPTNRGQKALGLTPAKIFYDFSTSNPVVVIRQGRRGHGLCIVAPSDVNTYDEAINLMLRRNTSNEDAPESEEAVQMVAVEETDDSRFSPAVRELCAKDQCGRPIQPIYYTAATVPDGEETVLIGEETTMDGGAEEGDTVVFQPTIMLLESLVTITDLPSPRDVKMRRRQMRRQNRRRGNGENGGGRRQGGRRQGGRRQGGRRQGGRRQGGGRRGGRGRQGGRQGETRVEVSDN